MSNTLLPCPFCGGEAEIVGGPENWTPTFYDPDGGGDPIAVVCKTCACGLHFFDGYAEAIAAWNRRTGKDINVSTNAQRIRSMSDEELHKFLLDFEAGDIDYAKTFCGLCCKDAALERKSTDCEGCLLWWLKNDATLPQGIDWLRQPVKEEHYEAD